ncbi:MAG TPA: DUF3826 domain-containing protein [Pirellulales bacterium]|jgi:hypothetical protein
MRIVIVIAFTLAALAAFPLRAADEKPADSKEAAYTQAIEKRTQDILVLLEIKDPTKLAKVHDAIIGQYRALNDWQTAHEAKLKELKAHPPKAESTDTTADGKPADAKKAAAKAAEDQTKTDMEARAALHKEYLAKLEAELTPEQIEKVKDKMTYNKVEVTYKAYCELTPNMTDADKAQVLSLLKDARELAMDGVNSKEKDDIFGKYKGKINNYLASQGKSVGKPKANQPAEPKTESKDDSKASSKAEPSADSK